MDSPDINLVVKGYLEYLIKAHVVNPQDIVRFTENELCQFIRKYSQPDFGCIYEQTGRKFYDDIRLAIPVNTQMRIADEQSKGMISHSLKRYSEFLQSKYFPRPKLFVVKDSKGTSIPAKSAQYPTKPKEREVTEGERKHVELERAQRNPILRQACIDKYGYVCQVCGLDFAKAYGEELGDRFIEVHHIKPIATFDESRPEDYLENLVPLCSNCHSMIHHGKDGPLSLHELREAYHGIKYDIPIWKED